VQPRPARDRVPLRRGRCVTADNHAVYKNGAKEIAAQQGMAITFMAKYDEREGNSCHIHLSLRDDRRGAAVRRRQPEIFDAFLAGQLACLRELTLLLAPNINSYKRFAAGLVRADAVAWGRDNRTCALRVVGHGPRCAWRTASPAPTSTPTWR
jgi:glutamine synthetase